MSTFCGEKKNKTTFRLKKISSWKKNHYLNTNYLAVYKEENRLQKEQIEQLDERLTETTELLSDRELMVQELENKQQHLAGKMKELTKEIHHIKSEGEGKALQQAQEELQEALEVKERVTLDLEKAKKVSGSG